jgi:EmrB/QacA subfamily drug resistance transporter
MKNLLAASLQPLAWWGRLQAARKSTSPQPNQAGLLIGLMVPVMMTALNFSMFSVVLPTIRNEFSIQADRAAWLLTAYMLPFTIFMPLYGRLGDALGKRRLFLIGIAIFLSGTAITLVASDLNGLIVGWTIQGLGAAGIAPLAMAIITQLVPLAQRGKTLGTWSSTAPLMGMIAPFLGGLVIDNLGWRVIFGPVLIVGIAAFWVVWKKIPSLPGKERQPFTFLRLFDWGGVTLLSVMLTTLIFYTSSRPITGVAAMQDWRLLGISLIFLGCFIYQERRRANPFVALNIFAQKRFTLASLCSSIRLFVMNGVAFLIPLYLFDIRSFNAVTTGTVLMAHSGAMLLILRPSGQLADRWGSRWLVVVSLIIQVVVMLGFAFLPAAAPIGFVIAGLLAHGFGSGLSTAPLDRAAIDQIPEEQMGVAAGLYNMIRMGGFVFGTAIAGVLLQYGLDMMAAPISAYQLVFGFMAGAGLLGALLSLGLRD